MQLKLKATIRKAECDQFGLDCHPPYPYDDRTMIHDGFWSQEIAEDLVDQWSKSTGIDVDVAYSGSWLVTEHDPREIDNDDDDSNWWQPDYSTPEWQELKDILSDHGFVVNERCILRGVMFTIPKMDSPYDKGYLDSIRIKGKKK